ncbi:hypothetical protein [Pseudoxanthomonas indica]|uniref:Uncharacterized protein n=1 Tax=Pseudoxanthomonas indica TaxID=428993 RepID=A0A1T5M0K9_9GAMM|nr:hypothetical protein [Pseudoxanthomonas indica]GGD60103.1 hypothetical protein GCM10007235_35350 [Pseudoxanthomonas indica]SKC81770.1 hypothetical protein SAMN06296058_3566 [Pseudoxanthomonas indica]
MQTRRIAGALALTLLIAAPASAVEVQGMRDFVALQGRYAPGGNCDRLPRFEVNAAGIRFEVSAGQFEQASSLEYAASYGGYDYEGPTQWFFPFGRDGNYPVLMAFNADEVTDKVSIEPHDEGAAAGPEQSAHLRTLVSASPYSRCRS